MSSNLTTMPYKGIDILFNESEPWLTQGQMAQLLGITQAAVSMAIGRATKRGEFEGITVHNSLLYTASDGKDYTVNYYSMDVFLVVAYRAENTPEAMAFRKWVTSIVK